MGSSLLLLLLLQSFWLYNSYEKAYHDFGREVDEMFRNTVMSLRDSAVLNQMEALSPDSVRQSKSMIVFAQKRDTLSYHRTARLRIARNAASQQVNMFVTSEAGEDSIKTMLKPILGKIHDGKMKVGDFVIRIGMDSLNLDTLHKYFSYSLASSGKSLPFKIKQSYQFSEDDLGIPPQYKLRYHKHMPNSEPRGVMVLSDTLKTDWVKSDPMNKYAAEFSGMTRFIVKEISPQILFSVFLTILTTVAFLVMYKNIKSQQRLMTIKNDFISNITHELKTPVTTVSVALEALRNFKGLEDPNRTQEYLDIAQGELNRLTLLTDKILKTATFESKGIQFETEPVDLRKTIEQVLHSMKLVFEKQKAQVSFEKKGNSFFIHGGSVHLTNVIYNLLDNAIKYSDGSPHISISLDDQETQVMVKVTDQGIGIPKEYTKKIFEKFFRVPMGDVHNVKGYGLGLSYVESVIKSHRGKIEVQSEKGKGSTFTIYLPKPAF